MAFRCGLCMPAVVLTFRTAIYFPRNGLRHRYLASQEDIQNLSDFFKINCGRTICERKCNMTASVARKPLSLPMFSSVVPRCGGSSFQSPVSYTSTVTSLATPTLSSATSLINLPPTTTASLPGLPSVAASSTSPILTPFDLGDSYCYVQSDRDFPHPADTRKIAFQFLDACLAMENDMNPTDPTRYWSQNIDDVGYWYSVSWARGCVLSTGATVENVGMPLNSNHPHCVDIFQQNIHECKRKL